MPDDHDPTGFDVARSLARSISNAPAPRKPVKRKPKLSSQRGDSGRDPVPLSEAVGDLLNQQGWTPALNVHLMLAQWPILVGPVNASHSAPEAFVDGVLTIRADSTTWATSLRQLAPRLIARLNEELGQQSVTRIVVIGPQAPNWNKGKRQVRGGRGPRDTYG